jgi:hypothetical protein
MHWYNASKDTLPPDMEEVLISHKGIYYIAFFKDCSKSFYLKDDADIFFAIGQQTIYWTKIAGDVFNN